jgi:hypothetical protein
VLRRRPAVTPRAALPKYSAPLRASPDRSLHLRTETARLRHQWEHNLPTDFIFFGLTGLALFVFRRRQPPGEFRTPGHPVTTGVFVLACWAIVIATLIKSPVNSAIGFAILAAGLPAYAWWRNHATTSVYDSGKRS